MAPSADGSRQNTEASPEIRQDPALRQQEICAIIKKKGRAPPGGHTEECPMSDTIRNFRPAFHGFNRDDVVQYISQSAARHETAIQALQDECQRLQTENRRLEEAARTAGEQAGALQEEQTALLAERDALREQNSAAEARIQALEEELASLQAGKAAPQSDPAPAPDWQEAELAAYRRAESMERIARARAAQLGDRMNGLSADLSVQLDEAGEGLSRLSGQLEQTAAQLRETLSNSRSALEQAAARLRAME